MSTLSKRNTANASSSVWWFHVLLAVILCVWLYVAERLDLSPLITISTVGSNVLLFGAATSARVDKLQQVWRRENRKLKKQVITHAASSVQFVNTLPALYAMFATVQRRCATSPMAIHYFAEWLVWALDSRRSNLAAWIRVSGSPKAQSISLNGLVKHIHTSQRVSAEQQLRDRAEGALIESILRRPSYRKTADRPTTIKQRDVSPTLVSVNT